MPYEKSMEFLFLTWKCFPFLVAPFRYKPPEFQLCKSCDVVVMELLQSTKVVIQFACHVGILFVVVKICWEEYLGITGKRGTRDVL